jgi:hypothetical protein
MSGGEYFPRVDDYEDSLAQVQSATGMYYVLGYPIRAEEDGKFHEIKVRVVRKGCEVRAQGGYFNPKPFRDYSEEAYLKPDGKKFVRSLTSVIYRDYKFFTVETDIKY